MEPGEPSRERPIKGNPFHLTLPEDCAEYMIVVVEPRATAESRNVLRKLEDVRKEALKLCDTLAKDYIWQGNGFQLDLKNDQGAWCLMADG